MRIDTRLLAAFALLAGLVMVPGCADDDSEARQDGWTVYRGPDRNHFSFGTPVEQVGVGMWTSASYYEKGLFYNGLVFLGTNGTPQDKRDDTWVGWDGRDGICGSGRVRLDPAGGLWVQGGGGICYLDPNGTPTVKGDDSLVQYSTADGLASGKTSGLDLDPSGGLWIGHREFGVDYLDYNGTPLDKTDDVVTNFSWADGLNDIFVTAIRVEPGAGIWFGHFNGVDFLDHGGTPSDKSDDTWTHFDMADGLVWPWINDIAVDPAGRKWIATWNHVSCLDDGGTPSTKSDDQWATFRIRKRPGYFNEVRSITAESSEVVWMGTLFKGVHRLDHGGTPFDITDDDSWYSMKRNGLPNNGVPYISIDSSGGKWASTRNGLSYLP